MCNRQKKKLLKLYLSGPVSYRDFRETGPRSTSTVLFSVLVSILWLSLLFYMSFVVVIVTIFVVIVIDVKIIQSASRLHCSFDNTRGTLQNDIVSNN